MARLEKVLKRYENETVLIEGYDDTTIYNFYESGYAALKCTHSTILKAECIGDFPKMKLLDVEGEPIFRVIVVDL